MIVYLTYVNIEFPYLHDQFISVFEFAKLDFLNNIINFDFFNYFNTDEDEL